MIKVGYKDNNLFVYSNKPLSCYYCNKELEKIAFMFHINSDKESKKYFVCLKCSKKGYKHKFAVAYSQDIVVILQKPDKSLNYDFNDRITLVDSKIDPITQHFNKGSPQEKTIDRTKYANRLNFDGMKIGNDTLVKEIIERDNLVLDNKTLDRELFQIANSTPEKTKLLKHKDKKEIGWKKKPKKNMHK